MEKLNVKNLIIIGVVLFFSIIGVVMYFSYNNTEIVKREQTTAQEDVCKANFDKMYKVINQVAQTAGQFAMVSKDAFKEIYPSLMEGRYGNERGGALLSMVTESNPNYDMKAVGELYKNLQNVIEANREEYFVEQKKLIDLQREHSIYIKRTPARWFISNDKEIEITIITSEKTKEVYRTAEENDINLFDKK